MLNLNVITIAFAAAIILPIASGIVGLFGRNSKTVNTAVNAINILGGAIGITASIAFLYMNARVPESLGLSGVVDFSNLITSLPPGLFLIDMLSAYFLLIINLGVLLVSWFSIWYLPRYSDVYRFSWLHSATALFIFGMQLAVIGGTPLVFLTSWEVMSFAAYFLVIADRSVQSVKAGFSYVAMTILGAAALIAGFAIITSGDFTKPLAFLSVLPSSSLGVLAISLLIVGFAAKAGIFPFHEWLPEAHPQAPSSVSALMSGVMLKVALYGLLRVFFALNFSIPLPLIFGVLALALFTAVYGAIMAVNETDIKKVLAWSSVENMGIMFGMAASIALFLSMGAGAAAGAIWIALLIQAISHTLFKTGLFMAAGALVSETHTRNLDLMGGLAKKWPIFSACFLALSVFAAALPPGSAFYAEWVFLQTFASIASYNPIIGIIAVVVISVFALTAGLAVFAMVKMFAAAFLSKSRSEKVANVKNIPFVGYAPVAFAGLLTLVLGFTLPYFLRDVLGDGGGLVAVSSALTAGGAVLSPFVVIVIFSGSMLIVYALRKMITTIRIRETDTWDCGAPINSRMEYTATGFSAPIRFFFRFLVLPWKKIVSTPVAPGNNWISQKSLELGSHPLAGRFLYRPVVGVIDYLALRVKRLQSGVVQFYLALILIALVVTLIVAL